MSQEPCEPPVHPWFTSCRVLTVIKSVSLYLSVFFWISSKYLQRSVYIVGTYFFDKTKE